MKRSDLAHILRAASSVACDPDIVVIGSQAILGSFSEDDLPIEATRSVEADIAFINDPDSHKADLVDGAIGELSSFHESFGYYAQGVSITTATLPRGWEQRAVLYSHKDMGASRAICIEANDLVISKLVAGREKDFEFATALLAANLVEVDILIKRSELLDQSRETIATVKTRIKRCTGPSSHI